MTRNFLAVAAALWLAAPALARAAFTPYPWLHFDLSPEEISRRCEASIKAARTKVESLKGITKEARTFENTPAGLDYLQSELEEAVAAAPLLRLVAVSSSVRQAAGDCNSAITKFELDLYADEELDSAVRAYAEKGEPLEGESKRLLEKTLLDFKRSGARLAPDKRKAFKETLQRLIDLRQAFERNIAEVRDYLPVTREELDGLPESYIARLEREGTSYKVTLDRPDFFPFVENSRSPNARRRLMTLYSKRAEKNLPILKEILALRQRAAELLGYPNHASFVLEERMAKNPKTVADFLARLDAGLKPLARKELEALLELKRREEGAAADAIIQRWDFYFYDHLLQKERYAVDHEKIKEYFPLDGVLSSLFSIYQKLLGIRFREIADAETWAPDVKLYEITEAFGGAPIAYFYVDLFPRDGKEKQAFAIGFVPERLLPDGSRRLPVAAIVANFDKPAKDRPSLLHHGDRGEVQTLFHEFGHVMYTTLSRARFQRFSGHAAWDFIEAPSQMLENWVWDSKILRSISGHYKDRSRKLPRELAAKLTASRLADVGIKSLLQVFFASIDMRYHTGPVEDTTAEWARLQNSIYLIPMTPGTHPEAAHDHLMGYDVGYYGYLWSKVYAQDMFTRFQQRGLLEAEIGADYRREILEPGGGREEMDSLRAFLKREPNEKAFLKSLGLGGSQP